MFWIALNESLKGDHFTYVYVCTYMYMQQSSFIEIRKLIISKLYDIKKKRFNTPCYTKPHNQVMEKATLAKNQG